MRVGWSFVLLYMLAYGTSLLFLAAPEAHPSFRSKGSPDRPVRRKIVCTAVPGPTLARCRSWARSCARRPCAVGWSPANG